MNKNETIIRFFDFNTYNINDIPLNEYTIICHSKITKEEKLIDLFLHLFHNKNKIIGFYNKDESKKLYEYCHDSFVNTYIIYIQKYMYNMNILVSDNEYRITYNNNYYYHSQKLDLSKCILTKILPITQECEKYYNEKEEKDIYKKKYKIYQFIIEMKELTFETLNKLNTINDDEYICIKLINKFNNIDLIEKILYILNYLIENNNNIILINFIHINMNELHENFYKIHNFMYENDKMLNTYIFYGLEKSDYFLRQQLLLINDGVRLPDLIKFKSDYTWLPKNSMLGKNINQIKNYRIYKKKYVSEIDVKEYNQLKIENIELKNKIFDIEKKFNTILNKLENSDSDIDLNID